MQHIIRLQLALMKPGISDIKIHVDSGGYAIKGHRIHIPVFTHPEVTFDVCPHRYVPDPDHVPQNGEPQRILDIQECFKIPTEEGFVFELNNRAAHKVSNNSPVPRVHVVMDLCEEPHQRVEVPPGTVCDYDMDKGLLCAHPNAAAAEVLPPARWLDAAAAALERGDQAQATTQQDPEQVALQQQPGQQDTVAAAAAAAEEFQMLEEHHVVMGAAGAAGDFTAAATLYSAGTGSAAESSSSRVGDDGGNGGSDDDEEDDVRAPVPVEVPAEQLAVGGEGDGSGGITDSALYGSDDEHELLVVGADEKLHSSYQQQQQQQQEVVIGSTWVHLGAAAAGGSGMAVVRR
jgi:hypothetical protein